MYFHLQRRNNESDKSLITYDAFDMFYVTKDGPNIIFLDVESKPYILLPNNKKKSFLKLTPVEKAALEGEARRFADAVSQLSEITGADLTFTENQILVGLVAGKDSTKKIAVVRVPEKD